MLLALTDVIWRVKSPKMSLYPSFFLLFLLGGRAAAVDSESALEDVVVVVIVLAAAAAKRGFFSLSFSSSRPRGDSPISCLIDRCVAELSSFFLLICSALLRIIGS